MGYCEATYNYMEKMVADAGFKWEGLKLCELGNQYLFHFPKGQRVARLYFESLGVKYTSIDWNGKDNALKIDLSIPLPDNIDQFDVVTNYGTSEHVKDNDQCFENIHRLCKKGGIMIHNLPKKGHWMKHSRVYTRYTIEFFEKLIEKYNYEKIDLKYWLYKQDKQKESVFATLRKK